MKIFNTLILVFFSILGWSQGNHCYIDYGQEMGQTVLQCENFDNYYIGYNISNAYNWASWSSSAPSPSVSTVRAHSGGKSLKFEDSYTNPDALYKLGDKTSGDYRLTWKMYVPYGKEGYFNIQHRELPGRWAYRVYFDSDRKGRLRVENDFYNFEYPQNSWFSVTQIIRLDSDKIELWIDGRFVKEWQFSLGDDGSYIRRLKQLGAINFYASDNDLYYVDDICFLEIDCTRVNDHISYVCVNGKEYANPTYAWCDGYTSEEWETGSCYNSGGCGYEDQSTFCNYISCTSEYVESYWTVNANNLSNMQVEYWELNGQRQSLTSNNLTFTVYQAGTYTICCYFRCGSEIIKCCKTVVCEPETPECCSDDPLSLPWVQDIVDSKCDTYGEYYEIWCATHNGNPVINITPPSSTIPGVQIDGTGSVYDCEGRLLGNYGFQVSDPIEFENVSKLWDNSDCSSTCTLISEDFSGYSNGYQIANDDAWARWSGSYSGTITADNELLKLDDTFGEESALLYLNESTSGVYNIKWNMYVLNNKNAGFGLYSKNPDGRYSSIKAINIIYNTYKGRWVEVNLIVDLNMNKVLVTIDGDTIVEESISNSKNLGLLSFHTNNGYACKFYVDDVIVEEENCSDNDGWGHLATTKTDKDARIISKESSLQETIEYTEEIISEIATTEQEKVGLTITNYPNPFTERTTIAFDLPEATDAALTIYDTNGRVAHFTEQNFPGGRNEVTFENDGRLAPGMYMVSLQANGEIITHSMLMLK